MQQNLSAVKENKKGKKKNAPRTESSESGYSSRSSSVSAKQPRYTQEQDILNILKELDDDSNESEMMPLSIKAVEAKTQNVEVQPMSLRAIQVEPTETEHDQTDKKHESSICLDSPLLGFTEDELTDLKVDPITVNSSSNVTESSNSETEDNVNNNTALKKFLDVPKKTAVHTKKRARSESLTEFSSIYDAEEKITTLEPQAKKAKKSFAIKSEDEGDDTEEVTANIIDEVIEDIWHVDLNYTNHDWFPQYLVKWDGFPPTENTIEPYEHVCHADVLKDYVRRKFEMHDDRIKEAMDVQWELSLSLYDKYLSKPRAFIEKKLRRFDPLKFKCNVLAYIYTYKKVGNTCNFMRTLRYHAILFKFYELNEQFKQKSRETLSLVMKQENDKFTIENTINFDAVPKFEYLKQVKNPFTDPIDGWGCSCEGECNKLSNCCPKSRDLEFIYDVDGRNSASVHQMIVECNDLCKCDANCLNRRKTTKIPLCIFKTADRGWAIKTRENIPPGTFVIEYTGELIDQTEAVKRSSKYRKIGNNYMFDLDYNENSEATYSIDATNAGNLSRFINHSCSPNLQTWPATTCNENPKMHRLYYFSLNQIRAGEELTVDYSGGVHFGPIVKPPKGADICKCGSANCKGFIF